MITEIIELLLTLIASIYICMKLYDTLGNYDNEVYYQKQINNLLLIKDDLVNQNSFITNQIEDKIMKIKKLEEQNLIDIKTLENKYQPKENHKNPIDCEKYINLIQEKVAEND